MIPLVHATEGDIEVYSFKAYVDGDYQEVGWDDDIFTAKPGADLEISLRLENKYNHTISVEVKGILFDVGGDIERTETIELEEDEKKSIVFEYYIPSDTKEGVYEYNIKYEYDAMPINVTYSYEHERTFEVDIREEKATFEDIILNLTRQISSEKDRSNELMDSLANLSGLVVELKDCKGDLEGYKKDAENYEEYKTKYDDECDVHDKCKENLADCEAKKGVMFSQSQVESKVNKAEQEAKAEQKKESDQFMLLGAGGLIAYFYFKRKKEKVGGEKIGESLTGTWG